MKWVVSRTLSTNPMICWMRKERTPWLRLQKQSLKPTEAEGASAEIGDLTGFNQPSFPILRMWSAKFTWEFPKIGVPPNIHFRRIFPYEPSIFGYLHFGKASTCYQPHFKDQRHVQGNWGKPGVWVFQIHFLFVDVPIKHVIFHRKKCEVARGYDFLWMRMLKHSRIDIGMACRRWHVHSEWRLKLLVLFCSLQ